MPGATNEPSLASPRETVTEPTSVGAVSESGGCVALVFVAVTVTLLKRASAAGIARESSVLPSVIVLLGL